MPALAYGAKAVLLGRPILWGLAIDGEEGVSRVLEMMRTELSMALLGCPSVADLSRDFIHSSAST